MLPSSSTYSRVSPTWTFSSSVISVISSLLSLLALLTLRGPPNSSGLWRLRRNTNCSMPFSARSLILLYRACRLLTVNQIDQPHLIVLPHATSDFLLAPRRPFSEFSDLGPSASICESVISSSTNWSLSFCSVITSADPGALLPELEAF